MENRTRSSAEEEDKEIVCYGVAWTKAESLNKEENIHEEEILPNTVEEVNLESSLLPKRNSFGTKDLKIETVSDSRSILTGKDSFESRKSPRKLKPIREVERLEMQKESLEIKVQELEEKLRKGKNKKNKESYVLQIKNTEMKIEMLGKRIAYEDRTTNIPLKRWENVKRLPKASKSLYVNSMRSDEILAKKMRAKLVLKEENGAEETLQKKGKKTNKWERRWKELVLEEKSDEEMEICGMVIRKPKRTTVFCPPIPDPMARKRPKDSISLKDVESGPGKQGEVDNHEYNSERRVRLVPNRKRLLLNRAKVYEKQLEFANKHDLETEDILDKLRGCQEELSDEKLAPLVTKQQLHLIGALSKDYVSP